MAIHQFSDSLPMMLYRALDVVMPKFRLIFKEFGLTEQQWRVMRVLWEHDQISFGRLAELTLLPRPSLVGIVDRVVAMGLIDKRRDSGDRRVVFIAATEDGWALRELVMPRVEATYAELEASIDSDTWQALLHGLACVTGTAPPDRSFATNE